MLHETRFGVYLDGGELGEILLPRKELPAQWSLGEMVGVFIYTDSEDRVVATTRQPKLLPGQCGRLKVAAITPVGAFLDWGLAKDLLVPFREQKTRMEAGRSYVVMVRVDEESQRLIGTSRLSRHLDRSPPPWRAGDAVDLLIVGRTPMGYQAIIAGTHTGLLFGDEVYQRLQPGEKLAGYIAGVREDHKIDLTLHPPGRARVNELEERILMEIKARGGYWALGDSSPAEEIHSELGVSKRTFKQAAGALLKKRRISLEPGGMRLA
jgi:predicted RNA-binding protein (virulence factor B family)